VCERIFNVGKLVDKVASVASQAKLRVVVVEGTGSPTQAFTVAFLLVKGLSAISIVRGGPEVVQRDVGRSSRLAAAAGVERNFGGRETD
jgi:hypothetical protein